MQPIGKLPSGQLSLSLAVERRIFQVQEVNAAVQQLFEADFRGISVAGEISGCRVAASGHYYFSLKDEQSQLKCVFFKGAARFARAKPQEGLAVIARGNLEVYQARGEYQLVVEALEPQGAGALQLAFEQLKQKLAAEGLFEVSRKRPLPKLPRRIGIVTSPAGAVISDMLHVLERRFAGLHIRLFPAQVQGELAADQICAGLHFFSTSGWPEVVILARGGGSLEDLWTFNEERVARAIARCAMPVISAIGHETDFTIADFVADYRAPTPSAAAEIVICTRASLLEQINVLQRKALQSLRYRLLVSARDLQQRGIDRAARLVQRMLTNSSQRADELDDRLRRAQALRLEQCRKQLETKAARLLASDLRLRFSRQRRGADLLMQQLIKLLDAAIWRARSRQQSLALHIRQLSPLAILERGYAIVQKPGGEILRDGGTSQAGDQLKVRLHRGALQVRVTESSEEQ